MLTLYKTTERGLEELESMANGTWVKVVDPTPEEIQKLVGWSIDTEYVNYSLDLDEMPRLERDDDFTFILKRELMWIPFFGWYLMKAAQVPIDRKAGSQALAAMNERARAEAARGRQVLIFPEGTRRAPGAPPAYKFGVAHLYANLGVPCLPVAINTGLFWPRRRFMRYPGTAVIEFLEPMPPGEPREVFFDELRRRIEGACERLLREGRAEHGDMPALARADPGLDISRKSRK